MASIDATAQIASAVSKLSLNTGSASDKDRKARTSKKKEATHVADSWEDEEISSSSESDDDAATPRHGGAGTNNLDAGTQAPPPTPMSPTYNNAAGRPLSPSSSTYPLSIPGLTQSDGPFSPEPHKRPEKTDAVARRMIAAGLGLKVPKQTDEQKAYDRAVREKERKRREQEREELKLREAEAEKLKQAIWED